MFRILHDEASGELTYLLADDAARQAVLVDPHGRDLPVLQALLDESDLCLRWVLRTHDHDALLPGEFTRLARLKAPVVQGRVCEGAHQPADGAILPFGHEHVRVLHTPGHAPGAVCLYVPGLDTVFTGDTLFNGGPGATGRSFSDRDTLVASIRAKLFKLPDDTVVKTGHGDDTTIGAEKATLGTE